LFAVSGGKCGADHADIPAAPVDVEIIIVYGDIRDIAGSVVIVGSGTSVGRYRMLSCKYRVVIDLDARRMLIIDVEMIAGAPEAVHLVVVDLIDQGVVRDAGAADQGDAPEDKCKWP